MNKAFVPSEWEEKLVDSWEKEGIFSAQPHSEKDSFSIILPPPNANGSLHIGHAMYVYEDVMIRYHKLLGKEVLWLPGADHAGFETQYVYEKYLSKQGKSRFDVSREQLYKDIWNFVDKNRGSMDNQLKKLGFALDWDKKKFTLDEDIIAVVYKTFEALYKAGLVYRGVRLVNYSPADGTAFSDLEVDHEEREDTLWHIKYLSVDNQESITVATTRPETMFGDLAVAVNPKDPRFKKLIGKNVIVPLVNRIVEIIGDEAVNPEFGTGAVKVTPAHDPLDWEIGERHQLGFLQVIGFDGRMNEEAGEWKGLKSKQAREVIVEKLKEIGAWVKEERITHRVPVNNKNGRPIEPLPKEQWFIKIQPLAEKAIEYVERGEIMVHPIKFKEVLIEWLKKFHDWNISRQIAWGIRIPAYKCITQNEWFISSKKPVSCSVCGSCSFIQDEDTFDTWFSSSQWPFATLQTQKNSEFYNQFYPTSVMETGYDILPWWVARMIMIGIFATGKVPFRHVYLHGMVRDKKGMKMSKSKGNVVDPLQVIEKYGADTLRAALVFQSTPGGDVNYAEDKVIGMRNYANKVWNIGRLLKTYDDASGDESRENVKTTDVSVNVEKIVTAMLQEHEELEKSYHKNMHNFEFGKAFDALYEYVWHRFADVYIEQLKEEVRSGNIRILEDMKKVFSDSLKLLHPFMPFVTEAVWKELYGLDSSVYDKQHA